MIYLFVLIATATMGPDSERVSFQTVGYYATAAECQHALIKAESTVNTAHVQLECQPIRAVK